MIKAIHFLNSGGGGTLSVVQNILRFSTHTEVEHHVIYTVNKDVTPDFTALNLAGAASEQVFFYSANWNFYYTCRRLAALIPSVDAVLIAHDWIELGMVSNLGLRNPVVQFLHGDFEYYYNLSVEHQYAVDKFIAVSSVIETTLQQILRNRGADILYSRFPVPFVSKCTKSHHPLRIVYCVNSLTEERKQFKLLPKINAQLAKLNVKLQWTIVGKGYAEAEVKTMMQQHEQINYYESLGNDEVHSLLTQQDIFILPSLSEGFPVSVVEAMKAGVVPLISNWKNATAELVKEGKTGYYFETGDVESYAQRISYLDNNRELLEQLSTAGVRLANTLFDADINTKAIEDIMQKAARDFNKHKCPNRVYGSRLDQPWLPNLFTRSIRGIK